MSNMSRAFVDSSSISQGQLPPQILLSVVANAINAVVGTTRAVELINQDYPKDRPLLRHAVAPSTVQGDLVDLNFILQGQERKLRVYFNDEQDALEPVLMRHKHISGHSFTIGADGLGTKVMETVARAVRCFGGVYFSLNEESPDSQLHGKDWQAKSLKELCSSTYGGTASVAGLRQWVGLFERKQLDYKTLGQALGIDEATAIRVPGWMADDDYEKLSAVVAML